MLLLALSACVYELVPDARICEDVGYAISARTLECTGDEALAVERHEQWEADAACLLSDEDPPEDNPDGILPMVESDYGAESQRLERLYGCVQAISELDCAAVEQRGDELGWWLRADPSCQDVARVSR